jgi:hypothetical protein
MFKKFRPSMTDADGVVHGSNAYDLRTYCGISRDESTRGRRRPLVAALTENDHPPKMITCVLCIDGMS